MGGEVPFPVAGKKEPKTINDLVGRLCRLIRPGDNVTQDFNAERVNIFLDEKSQIKKVTAG